MGSRKNMIWIIVGICILLVVGLVVRQTKPSNVQTSTSPKSIATTFKGDPQTTRAFIWYTESVEEQAMLQVAEGTKVDSWDRQGIVTFKAKSAQIDTGGGKQQYAHQAEATGLKPGTSYTYRVGSEQSGAWSDPAVIVTEPASPETFTFVNVTDSQGESEADFKAWGHTLDQAFGKFPEARFIVHNGDLTEDPDQEKEWDSFFGQAAKWLVKVPLMPVTGNHDEIQGNAKRFTSHFAVPANGAEGAIPGTNYSFNYGYAHIVVLDTESNLKVQTSWLRGDLQSNRQPWTIVAMHRPAYGGNRYEKIEDWIKVFDEYGVDLVLQGHNHEYSRSFPLRDGNIVSEGEGTVYVITNTAGPKFNSLKKDKYYHAVHFQNNKQMFAGVTVSERTLSLQAYDVDGNLLDKFTLQR